MTLGIYEPRLFPTGFSCILSWANTFHGYNALACRTSSLPFNELSFFNSLWKKNNTNVCKFVTYYLREWIRICFPFWIDFACFFLVATIFPLLLPSLSRIKHFTYLLTLHQFVEVYAVYITIHRNTISKSSDKLCQLGIKMENSFQDRDGLREIKFIRNITV
jgi:hypothetical protein